MRTFFFFFLLLLATAAAAAARPPLLGGYSPIKNLNDPHIKEIALYAVSEHNKQSGESLALVRIVSGRQQVVGGMNYDLVIEAKGVGGPAKQYEAIVYERAWENFRSLTSFKPKA